MLERQAFGIDINEFSRTGGINYNRVNGFINSGGYDFLITKAGLGNNRSPLLAEHQQQTAQRGIPLVTYHLVDPRVDMREQARSYVNWVGTGQTAYILDVESPNPAQNVPPPTRDQLLRNIDELTSLTQKQPILYSNVSILKQIGFLNDAAHFKLWLAQYLFDRAKLPDEQVLYTSFDDFCRDHAGQLPPDSRNTVIQDQVILWQFTAKGNGRHYIYNEKTADPQFQDGMFDADLNVSIPGRGDFLKLVYGIDAGVPAEQLAVPVVPAESPVLVPTTGGSAAITTAVATYPGTTNQDMINFIFHAAAPFTQQPWQDWVVPAGLESMAVPDENRGKPYTGPRIEDLPNLSADQKAAIERARVG